MPLPGRTAARLADLHDAPPSAWSLRPALAIRAARSHFAATEPPDRGGREGRSAVGLFASLKSVPAAAPGLAHDEAEWQRRLTPEQYRVLRRHGTERPGTSPLDREHRPGRFLCAGCDAALFVSDAKFDSGTGWPSFTAPVSAAAVGTREDRGLLMSRTEVHCARCGGHLGHVFPDGPRPTGLRYCMNGQALDFKPADEA